MLLHLHIKPTCTMVHGLEDYAGDARLQLTSGCRNAPCVRRLNATKYVDTWACTDNLPNCKVATSLEKVCTVRTDQSPRDGVFGSDPLPAQSWMGIFSTSSVAFNIFLPIRSYTFPSTHNDTPAHTQVRHSPQWVLRRPESLPSVSSPNFLASSSSQTTKLTR